MSINDLIKIFLAGITLGNGPCLFICLPIVLPYIIASSKPQGKLTTLFGLKLTLLFSVSRLISYSLLGFLSVSFYRFIQNIVGLKDNYLQFILGVLIILIGFFYLIGEKLTLLNPVCNFFQKTIINHSNINIFLFSFLIGFSPCAPLIAILTYIAAMAKNSLSGLIAGFSFGLGTLITPLIPAGVFTGFIVDKIKTNSSLVFILRIFSAILLIYFGFRLIFTLTTV